MSSGFKSVKVLVKVKRLNKVTHQASEARVWQKGPSATVLVPFIPAAVAEGGILVKGYLWWLLYGVNTRYSLYISMAIYRITFLLILVVGMYE